MPLFANGRLHYAAAIGGVSNKDAVGRNLAAQVAKIIIDAEGTNERTLSSVTPAPPAWPQHISLEIIARIAPLDLRFSAPAEVLFGANRRPRRYQNEMRSIKNLHLDR